CARDRQSRDDVTDGVVGPASPGPLIADRSLKRITVVPRCGSALLPGLANRTTEKLRRSHGRPALLALDEERRWEPGAAGRAEVAHLAGAVRARRWDLDLELANVARREAAPDAEGDPVAQRLTALLLDPVPFRLPARRHERKRSRARG